jgi:hypothetical protein
MPTWICDTCGQRIRRARDGWLSGTSDADGRATIALVHHAASPWAALGGCCPPDEQASVHLLEALRRDAPVTVQGLLEAGAPTRDASLGAHAQLLPVDLILVVQRWLGFSTARWRSIADGHRPCALLQEQPRSRIVFLSSQPRSFLQSLPARAIGSGEHRGTGNSVRFA